MKQYKTPSVEVIELEKADIITLSGDDLFAVYDDKATMPGNWFVIVH